MNNIIYKVPDGKLLKLSYELDDNNVFVDFKLRGDFFLYPEEAFLDLEKFVIGKPLNSELFMQLESFVMSSDFEIFGFAVSDLKLAFGL